jgi:hypothetical protein
MLRRCHGLAVTRRAEIGVWLGRQVSPSPGGEIVLEARGKGGQRRLVRHFREAGVSAVPASR